MSTPSPIVVIFGSGRSGTTWVQDALAEANDFATVFEPLHPDTVAGAAPFANLYVPPDASAPGLVEFMDSALRGHRSRTWSNLRTRPDRLRPTLARMSSLRQLRDLRASYVKLYRNWQRYGFVRNRPAVVKFIRGNLMAEWIAQHYAVPAAVIVRHPCAVLSSVLLRHGQEWEQDAVAELLARYLAQESLVSDRLAGILPRVESLRSFAAQHTAVWCIENGAFLGARRSERLAVEHYESLLMEPAAAWTRLTKSLGLPRQPDAALQQKPSQQASYQAIQEGVQYGFLDNWRQHLDEAQLDDVQAVLDLFGIATYSVDSPIPVAPDSDRGEPAATVRISRSEAKL